MTKIKSSKMKLSSAERDERGREARLAFIRSYAPEKYEAHREELEDSKLPLKDLDELKSEQTNFTGTEQYHTGYMGVQMTDGVFYTQERAKCGWLMSDASVILKMKLKDEEFVVVKAKVKNHKAVVTYDDGNGKVLYTQKYEYTDLPEGEFKMYYENGVLMLPSER
jgi:hypothetical protein